MKLKDIPKEELELMGYDDIAYIILEESKKKMKITDLFQKICDALGLSQKEYEDHIADFFEILTTDKKFVMLEDGYWDLRTRHSEKLVIEDDDEEYEEAAYIKELIEQSATAIEFAIAELPEEDQEQFIEMYLHLKKIYKICLDQNQ